MKAGFASATTLFCAEVIRSGMRPRLPHPRQMAAKSRDMTVDSLGFIFEDDFSKSATNVKNVLRFDIVAPIYRSCYESTDPHGFRLPAEIEKASVAELARIGIAMGDQTSG